MWILTEKDVEAIQKAVLGKKMPVINPNGIESALGNAYFTISFNEHASFDYLVTEIAYQILRGFIQNHPFSDGNKRTALACAHTFLKANGYDIDNSDPTRVTKVVVGICDPLERSWAKQMFKENLVVCKRVCASKVFEKFENEAKMIFTNVVKALRERSKLYKRLGFHKERDFRLIPFASISVARSLTNGRLADANFDSIKTITEINDFLCEKFSDQEWLGVLIYHVCLLSDGKKLTATDDKILKLLGKS